MATVEISGKPPVKYADLNVSKMKKILANHVFKGTVVVEYALAVDSERTH